MVVLNGTDGFEGSLLESKSQPTSTSKKVNRIKRTLAQCFKLSIALSEAVQLKYSIRLDIDRSLEKIPTIRLYRIDGNLSLQQVLLGFGDAVCVSAIEGVAEYCLNLLVEELMEAEGPTAELAL